MSDYTIINGELYHYGVPGMKWGVRRYQNPDGTLTEAGRKRQARVYTKALNKLDKLSSKQNSIYIENDYRMRKLNTNPEGEWLVKRIPKEGSTLTKKQLRDNKLYDKRSKQNESTLYKRNMALKNIDYVQTKTNEIINKASSEGYTVNSKQVYRSYKLGEYAAARFIAGPLGAIGYQAAITAMYYDKYPVTNNRTGRKMQQSPMMVVGNKYKVK